MWENFYRKIRNIHSILDKHKVNKEDWVEIIIKPEKINTITNYIKKEQK